MKAVSPRSNTEYKQPVYIEKKEEAAKTDKAEPSLEQKKAAASSGGETAAESVSTQ